MYVEVTVLVLFLTDCMLSDDYLAVKRVGEVVEDLVRSAGALSVGEESSLSVETEGHRWLLRNADNITPHFGVRSQAIYIKGKRQPDSRAKNGNQTKVEWRVPKGQANASECYSKKEGICQSGQVNRHPVYGNEELLLQCWLVSCSSVS